MDLVVDPGTKQTGITVWLAGVPMPWCAKIKQPTSADVAAILRWAKRLDPSFTLVIEGQHVRMHPGKGGKQPTINWPSVTALMLSAHRWIVCAELELIPVEVVQPAEWQGPSFATVENKGPDGKKLTTKDRSELVVHRSWSTVRRLELEQVLDPNAEAVAALGGELPAAKLTKDECDSAVMGRWWRLHGKRARAGR